MRGELETEGECSSHLQRQLPLAFFDFALYFSPRRSRACSAPLGHLATCAAISSADAAFTSIHRLRRTSNTARSPRTHTPVCRQIFGSKVTTISSFSYVCSRFGPSLI